MTDEIERLTHRWALATERNADLRSTRDLLREASRRRGKEMVGSEIAALEKIIEAGDVEARTLELALHELLERQASAE
jgi:hypothetical protein